MERRRVSKVVLDSMARHKSVQDQSIRVYNVPISKEIKVGLQVRDDLQGIRVRDSEPGIRVRDDLPGFRVHTDVPSYRVRNDVPGPGRVYSKLPETRVRPGGLPATRVHRQHQETIPKDILHKRSHRRTRSTNTETSIDPRIARFRVAKAKMELERASQYQNFSRRRRFFVKEQIMRLVPNRDAPRSPNKP